MIDNWLKIDVDITDFRHTIGKVGLTRAFQHGSRGYSEAEEENEEKGEC